MSSNLGRQEWIDAGLRALAEQGLEAVRVERLATVLGVTKGSFYWHFRDRGALLAALLEAWRVRATGDVIDEVEAKGGDAGARLRTLFEIVAQGGGRLDRAVQAWASQDASAKQVLAQVDQRRLAYLEALFVGLGFTAREATARARFAYHALIGQFMMGTVSTREARRAEWVDILYPMLVRRV